MDFCVVLSNFVSARMSQINVMICHVSPDFSDHDLNGRALDEDANLDLSLFPGLGRGAEDKLARHEH